MTMDQNESAATQGQQGPPPIAGTANTANIQDGGGTPAHGGQANTGQRRRRRRRKTGKPPSVAAQSMPDAAPDMTGTATPAPVTASGVVIEAGAEPARREPREQRPGNQPGNQPGDTRQAQGNGQPGGQQHKKQQRQGKGGGGGGSRENGSNQPRHFSKGASQPQPREYNPGNGSAPQGNARRKNKVRRPAPGFVGPMDHSYRVVNGNIADGPPSTMDYRSNGNGNGNIHGRSGFNGYVDQAEASVPVIVRDDAPSRILCFIEDLFVVAKMQETARKLGVKVSFLKNDKDTITRLTESPEAERPSLIVFDLNNANAKPLTLIPKLKAKLKRGTSVIGFLSHIQGDLKAKAVEAGCDMVMPKSAFSQNLPNLLRRHGLDEELETADM